MTDSTTFYSVPLMNSKISMYGNKRMLFGVLLLVFLIFLLWYFCHPLSPYNERTTYVAAFSDVGPVGSGNNVKIGGLPKGRILGMHKTDSCIYVQFEVVSEVQIPKDSKFTFATAGFLGNREIQIDRGTSDEFYTSKDTIFETRFDKGLNSARADLDIALAEFQTTLETVTALLDTIEKGSDRKTLDRVIRKGKNLVATAQSDFQSWKSEAETLFENLSASAEKLQNSVDKIKTDANTLKSDATKTLAKLEELKNSAETTKAQLQKVLEKIDQNDNSVALILQKGGEVSKQLDAISASAQALISDVKKNGIKLNVDIF